MKKKMILVWTIIALCAALCGCGGKDIVQDGLPLLAENTAQEELAEIEVEVKEMPGEEDEMFFPEEIFPVVIEEVHLESLQQQDTVVVLEDEAKPVDTIRPESPYIMNYYYDVPVEEVEVTEQTEETSYSPYESPSMTVPPKTGYECTFAEPVEDVTPVLDVVSVPEPAAPAADLDAVMAVANNYAASVYGCVIDPALNMGNSSYRYPAYAAADADQATAEAKARDIVDYTFRQLMQQNGVTLERLTEAGIRCNVYAYRDGDGIFLYCLYA